MGADLCICYVPYFEMTAARKRSLKAVITALGPDDLDEELLSDVFNAEGETHEDCMEDAKVHLKALVDEFEDLAGRRDTGVLAVRGMRILLTGGMSWGDEPTDAYATVSKLTAIPALLDALEAFSLEEADEPSHAVVPNTKQTAKRTRAIYFE